MISTEVGSPLHRKDMKTPFSFFCFSAEQYKEGAIYAGQKRATPQLRKRSRTNDGGSTATGKTPHDAAQATSHGILRFRLEGAIHFFDARRRMDFSRHSNRAAHGRPTGKPEVRSRSIANKRQNKKPRRCASAKAKQEPVTRNDSNDAKPQPQPPSAPAPQPPSPSPNPIICILINM